MESDEAWGPDLGYNVYHANGSFGVSVLPSCSSPHARCRRRRSVGSSLSFFGGCDVKVQIRIRRRKKVGRPEIS